MVTRAAGIMLKEVVVRAIDAEVYHTKNNKIGRLNVFIQ